MTGTTWNDRDVYWLPWCEPGCEHLRLRIRDRITADSVILRLLDRRAYRWRYRVECNPEWRLSRILIQDLDEDTRLDLTADGAGVWIDGNGKTVDALRGCLDVDISATPFTNTLAIRRMKLSPGATRDLTVAYVKFPEMTVQAVAQRYTCVSVSQEGGVYRYDGLFRNFSSELRVDADGLVLDYPDTFKRAWPKSGAGRPA